MMFIEQLKADAAFLQMLRIMDYSLLIGVHDVERGNKDKLREGTLTMFSVGCVTILVRH
jgi:1-phosphatidylinositol-4-phosphate 5-kinase